MIAFLTFALALSQDKSLAVQAKFDELFTASKLPSLSVCVILPDGKDILLAKGTSDEEGKTPTTTKARFLGGSTGKTFFAVLAMQLAKEGVISLDDPLEAYLGNERWYSSLPNGKSVSLRQLMRHESGIPEHVQDVAFLAALKADPFKTWKPAELVSFICGKEPLFPAGQGWSYADTNYILLAMAIEKASGKNAYSMIQERFLRPLKLSQTEPSVKMSYSNLANGKLSAGNPFGEGWSMSAGSLKLNPQMEWAGGGFVTSPRDLARWFREVMTGKVIDQATRDEMTACVPAKTGRGHFYGLGLMKRPSDIGFSYGHGGWYPGYITDVQHFVDSNITVCIQANTDDLRAFGRNYQQFCVELAKAAQ